MNKIILCGNLTRDPDLATTQNGKDYCKFAVAVQRKFKDAAGNKMVDFVNCVSWGKLATEVVGKYGKKGTKVLLSGELQSNKGSGDFEKITYWQVVVDDFELLGNKNDNANGNANANANLSDNSSTQSSTEDIDQLPF